MMLFSGDCAFAKCKFLAKHRKEPSSGKGSSATLRDAWEKYRSEQDAPKSHRWRLFHVRCIAAAPSG